MCGLNFNETDISTYYGETLLQIKFTSTLLNKENSYKK